MASDPEFSQHRAVSAQPGPPSRGAGETQQSRLSLRGQTLSPRLFGVLAVLLLLLLVCLGLMVVVAATYSQAAGSAHRSLDRGWALLSVAAMVWALVNVYWSSQAARRRDGISGTNGATFSWRSAMLGHFAIAISCGLIALGVHAVSVARAFGTDPIVMDYSHWNRSSGGSDPAPVVIVAGNVEEGRKVFSTTCITCHGPTGDGLPNLAPSLRGSAFIGSADDAAIAGVIRLGRAVTDPNNKTKKMMPARGGNPFLGDDKISHLVAFVRAMQSESPGAVASDPDAPPPVQLAKWVVPIAPPPPTGLVSLADRPDIGDDRSLALRFQSRKSVLVKTLTLASTGIHSLFLVGVMVASTQVLLRGLRDEIATNDESWWTWSTLGWIAAAVVWVVVFVFGFVML